MNERVQKIKEAIKKTDTTFQPSQQSTTEQLSQLLQIANATGLYDAADWLKARLEPSVPKKK